MQEIKELIDKKTVVPNTIDVGITWVDGRIFIKHHKKQSQSWYGICHYSNGIAILTPLDYDAPTMITSLHISIAEQYCERAHSCLCFDCPLNRFDIRIFLKMFKDVGGSSLGMPMNLGTEPLWFNSPKYRQKWKDFIIPVTGGRLQYDQKKGKELGIGD